jgi:hypothetical protein
LIAAIRPPLLWLAVIGTLLSALVLVYQYRHAGAVVIPFTEADWQAVPGGAFVLDVDRRLHGRRSPTAEVYIVGADGQYEQVECDVKTGPAGTIRLGASQRFGGQLRVC